MRAHNRGATVRCDAASLTASDQDRDRGEVA